MEIAVNPNWRTVPRRCVKLGVPCRSYRVGIEHAVQLCDGSAGSGVAHRERRAAAKVMRTGTRAAGDIDPLHRGDELPESERRVAEIRDGLNYRVLAGKPSANQPAPRVTLSRHPHRKRYRNGKRQMRR